MPKKEFKIIVSVKPRQLKKHRQFNNIWNIICEHREFFQKDKNYEKEQSRNSGTENTMNELKNLVGASTM